MVGPVRVDGLSSGIDYSSIIEKLLAAQRRPIARFEERGNIITQRKTALQQLNISLLSVKSIMDSLSRPSFFNTTKTVSGVPEIINATGTQVQALGAYSFSSRRLASAHQILSNGFVDSGTTAVTAAAAELTLELGGGYLERSTLLERLNGGNGVDRGEILITDSANNVYNVDLHAAVDVRDVVSEIGAQTKGKVIASLAGDRIVLKDLAGGAASNFTVKNTGNDSTATDLGIDGTGVAGTGGNYVYGKNINAVSTSSSHLILNDGLGVRRNSDGVNDFSVAGPDAVTFNVDLQAADLTVSQILSRINTAATAAGSSVVASLTGDGTALQLLGTGAGGFTITPLNSSFAAVDLGLGNYSGSTFTDVTEENGTTGAPAAGTGNRLIGNRFRPTLNSLMRNQLNGGQTHASTPANVTAAAASGATSITVDSVNGYAVGDRVQIIEGGVTQVRKITGISSTTLTIDTGLTSAITTAADVQDLQGVGDGTVTFTDRDGASFSVNLNQRINTTTTAAAAGGATSIVVSSASGLSVGNKLRIVDSSTIQYRTITAISGTTVSFDQGLTSAISSGANVYTDHATLGQIVNSINDRASANSVKISAEINPEGNGLRVIDSSGGTGTMSVVDTSGTAAADLGIAGSTSTAFIEGADLDPRYLSPFTTLSSLNGGSGVQAGKIRIIDRSGNRVEVDLSQSTDSTIGAVLTDINGAMSAAGSSLTARLNNSGDGILLIDTGAGTGTVRVEEAGSTRTAADLFLLGSAPSGTPQMINGSFERRIAIKAGATLSDIRGAIADANLPVSANIIFDGSPVNPYRLSILSKKTGAAGRVVMDSDISGLSFKTSSEGRDSVLLYGAGEALTDPVLLTSSSNRFTDIVPGMTLELLGAEEEETVTVTVSRDLSGITDMANRFVEKYNTLVQLISELTFYDPATQQRGPLFTDPTARQIQTSLASLISQSVSEIPSANLRSLSDIGFKLTNKGGMTLDTGKLFDQLSGKFDQVLDLFTRQRKLLLDTKTTDLNNGLGAHPVAGADLQIRARNAIAKFTVDLDGASSLGAILSAINNATGNSGAVTASISSDGFSIVLTDNTTVPTRAVEAPTTTTSFIESDADIDALSTGHLIGATVTFLTGANAGQVRTVSAFDTSTNTITFSSALPVAPTAGDTYRIERELEVEAQNKSPVASELKILKKARLGDTQLKGELINLKGDPGVAFRLSERLDQMTRDKDGMISTRLDSLDDTIEGFRKSILRIEERVKKEEERLIREFAHLETVLAKSQSTSQNLQGALAGLNGLISSFNRR